MAGYREFHQRYSCLICDVMGTRWGGGAYEIKPKVLFADGAYPLFLDSQTLAFPVQRLVLGSVCSHELFESSLAFPAVEGQVMVGAGVVMVELAAGYPRSRAKSAAQSPSEA